MGYFDGKVDEKEEKEVDRNEDSVLKNLHDTPKEINGTNFVEDNGIRLRDIGMSLPEGGGKSFMAVRPETDRNY